MTWTGEGSQPERPRGEPIVNLPSLTLALIVVNLAIHGLLSLADANTANWIVGTFGTTPARYLGGPPGDTLSLLAAPFASMFLHGGWVHVGVNMASLAAYGSPLERVLGWRRYLGFYVVTGLAGDLLHVALHATSDVPVIGASGAISGLFGGLVIIMRFNGELRGLLPLVVVYLVTQVGFGLMFTAPGGGGIAWAAHLGGFFAGMALIWPFMRGRLRTIAGWRGDRD